MLLILVWVRTAECSINLGPGPVWTELIEKNCEIFAIKRPYFINFGHYLDLDFKYLTLFGLRLDLD